MFRLFKIVFVFILIVSFVSCQKQEPQRALSTLIPHTPMGVEAKLSAIDIIPYKNTLTTDADRFTYLIAGYSNDRDSISKEFAIIKQRKWNELIYVVDQRKFYVKPVLLDTVYWYDACNGVDMLSVTSVAQDEAELAETDSVSDVEPNELTYIYLAGLDVRQGVVPSHFHKQTGVVPGSPYRFQFGDKQYVLRAEGKVPDYIGTEVNSMGRKANYVDGYTDYKLYLESDGIVQLLNSGQYDHTCLEILFIGDLDGDGKPDFLFETNTWYEGGEVTLYLSSKAIRGKLVKNMGASGNYYSC